MGIASIEHDGSRTATAAAPNRGDEGFTLVELLIVIFVLGILVSTVLFELSGVTGRTVQASCTSDARTVSIAAAAYRAEHPGSLQVTEGQLVSTGSGSLQSWPQSPQGAYSIVIAGDGNVLAGTTDATGNMIADNDVLVHVGTDFYDASSSVLAACTNA